MVTYAFDVRFARPAALDGIGRALWNTVPAIAAALMSDERLVLISAAEDGAAWARHAPDARIHTLAAPIASLAQHGAWTDAVAASGADVVHYPQYDLPKVPPGVGVVVTVYDFTVVDEPGYFGGGVRRLRALAASALLAGTCARATILTTLSHAVAREIAARMPATAARVRVVEPGPSRLPPPRHTPGRERALFVYVGNHRPHKRVELLLRAFARYRAVRSDARLVLMGRSDARFPGVIDALRGPLGAGVTHVEGAADEEVARTLAAARALVFPSVGEGYGFPVIEALSLGTPAIVADAGSLPEVLDGAGLVVAPDDEEAWARALHRMDSDDDLWQAATERARIVVAGLSWERCATKLVAAWRDALPGGLPNGRRIIR